MAVKYLNEFSGFNSLKLSVHKIPIHSLLKNFHFGERIQEVADSGAFYLSKLVNRTSYFDNEIGFFPRVFAEEPSSYTLFRI